MTSVRVLNRTFRELEPDVYEIALELSPPRSDPVSIGSVYGILWQPHNGYYLVDATRITWYGDGDAADHPPGYPDRPTTGLIAPTIDSSLPNGRDHTGWTINGTGTVDATFTCTFTGVNILNGGNFTANWAIKKNGVVVASDSTAFGPTSKAHEWINTVSVAALSVQPGDTLTAHCWIATPFPFFTVPAGVGVFEEQFEISGGSLS